MPDCLHVLHNTIMLCAFQNKDIQTLAGTAFYIQDVATCLICVAAYSLLHSHHLVYSAATSEQL